MSISDTTHDIVESQGIRISTVKGAVTVADELPIIVISTAVYIKNPDTKEPKTHADVGDFVRDLVGALGWNHDVHGIGELDALRIARG